jgi:hypothetical protein
MDGFTGDGYRDLEAFVEEIQKETFPSPYPKQHGKRLVASLLHQLLAKVDTRQSRDAQAREFYEACWEMVDCAQKDELI